MPQPSDDADAIAAALARLRGRRMPRPPWEAGPHGPRGGWEHRDGDHHGHGHGHRGRGPGPAPWLAGARLGGPARVRLLEALAAASHPLSVGEIADAIGVDQPRASRLVQQCVEHGLARREADPDDARRTRIVLTEGGRRVVQGFRGDRRAAIGTALEDFSDAERAELARLLSKLADAWPQG